MDVIFQIGARGGRYPYRDIARKHCTDYVLIVPRATADEFVSDPQLDGCRIVQVENPADEREIISALREIGYLGNAKKANYFFPERDLYAPTAFHLRRLYGDGIDFRPPDKKTLYDILSQHRIPQLKTVDVNITSEISLIAAGVAAGFPSVLKPYNASACLGVIPVFSQQELLAAARTCATLTDESGNALRWSLQRRAKGPEYSVQGYVGAGGDVRCLSACQKLVIEMPGRGYYEAGHLGCAPEKMGGGMLVKSAEAIIQALKYPSGPWTIDFVQDDDDGELYAIDFGARLPGLAVQDVVSAVSGLSLAEVSYLLQAGRAIPPASSWEDTDHLYGYVTLQPDEIVDWRSFNNDIFHRHKIRDVSVAFSSKGGRDPRAAANAAQAAYFLRGGAGYAHFTAEDAHSVHALFTALTSKRGGVTKPMDRAANDLRHREKVIESRKVLKSSRRTRKSGHE